MNNQPRGLYAADTTVSPEKSRAEIEAQLKRYSADRFGFSWDRKSGTARVEFTMGNSDFRLEIARPTAQHPRVRYADRYNRFPDAETIQKRIEQIERQRWRALALFVKAALEAVDAGAVSIEHLMLPYTILPNDETLGQFAPQIKQALSGGRLVPLLIEQTDIGVIR